MNISGFILPLLLALLATPALAQERNASDKAHAKGMSYEEYAKQREKMLKRLEGMSPQQRKQALDAEGKPGAEPKGETGHSSAYGQGYGSRKDAADSKSNVEKPSRPERPHVERPGRP